MPGAFWSFAAMTLVCVGCSVDPSERLDQSSAANKTEDPVSNAPEGQPSDGDHSHTHRGHVDVFDLVCDRGTSFSVHCEIRCSRCCWKQVAR